MIAIKIFINKLIIPENNLVPMYISKEEDWNILASGERDTNQAFIVMVTKERLNEVLENWEQNSYKFLFDKK